MVRVQTKPFDAGALLNDFAAGRTGSGAVVSFTGLARAATDGAAVSTLELRLSAVGEFPACIVIPRE